MRRGRGGSERGREGEREQESTIVTKSKKHRSSRKPTDITIKIES